MNYGCAGVPTTVFLKGFTPLSLHSKWARDHESTGTYNYQRHGIIIDGERHVRWEFSNPEDAVLFALKFK